MGTEILVHILNLEYPEEKNEEQDWYRWSEDAIEKKPTDDTDTKIGSDFTP